MTLERPPVETLIEWIEGSPEDVSSALAAGRLSHGGSAEQLTPQVSSGRGSIRLDGDRYRPGASALGNALFRRAAVTIKIEETELWKGWAEHPSDQGRGESTVYQLRGLLESSLRNSSETISNEEDPLTDKTVWEGLSGELPSLVGQKMNGRTFQAFVVEDRVGRIIGTFALLTGRLAGEDRRGKLILPSLASYGRPADEIVSRTTEVGSDVGDQVRTEHLRNTIRFPYPHIAGALTEQVATLEVSPASIPGAETSHEVMIPTSEEGDSQQDFTATMTVHVNIVDRTYFAVGKRFQRATLQRVLVFEDKSVEVEVSGQTATVTLPAIKFRRVFDWYWIVENSNPDLPAIVNRVRSNILIPHLQPIPSDNPRKAYTSGRLAPLPVVGTQFDDESTGDGDRRPVNFPVINSLEVEIDVRYNLMAAPVEQVLLVSQPSVVEWGEQVADEEDFSAWLDHRQLQEGRPLRALLQADLDRLGQPRRFVTIALPLWQRDEAAAELVRRVDFGSYLVGRFHDLSQRVDLAAALLVVERTLLWGRRRPYVVLRCLVVGDAPPGPVPGARAWSSAFSSAFG